MRSTFPVQGVLYDFDIASDIGDAWNLPGPLPCIASELAAKSDNDRFKLLSSQDSLQQGIDLAHDLIVFIPVSAV